MKDKNVDEQQTFIYRPYITKNGKRIFRKGGGMFKIPVTK